ncbi:tetratricopeptide repeat protein [Colwelliaceae bacterium BS250]
MIIKIKLILILVFSSFSINSFAAKIGPCQTDECVGYFKEYKKYARAGYADAMATLADLYYYGHGTDINLKMALKQYKSAAKYGSVKGQYKTAMIYLTDKEYKDLDQGVKYLKKAARNKNKDAAFLLGVIYFKPKFYERDFSEVDKWLTQAYKQRHKKANSFIDVMKESGEFNSENFPDLIDEISSNPIQVEIAKTDSDQLEISQQPAPADNAGASMEVITITSNLHDMFSSQIASLRNTYPEKGAQTTGSKIIGKSCAQTMSCGVVNMNDYNVMVGNIMGAHSVAMFYP